MPSSADLYSGHHRWPHERRLDSSVVYEGCVPRGDGALYSVLANSADPPAFGVANRLEPTDLLPLSAPAGWHVSSEPLIVPCRTVALGSYQEPLCA
jgi:hypothetical protein